MEVPGSEIGEVIILRLFDLSLYDTLFPSRSLLLKVSGFFFSQTVPRSGDQVFKRTPFCGGCFIFTQLY